MWPLAAMTCWYPPLRCTLYTVPDLSACAAAPLAPAAPSPDPAAPPLPLPPSMGELGSTGVNDTMHWCAAIVSTHTRCIVSLKSTLERLAASAPSPGACCCASPSAGDGLAPPLVPPALVGLVTSVVVPAAPPLSVEADAERLLTALLASAALAALDEPAGTAPSDWLAWWPAVGWRACGWGERAPRSSEKVCDDERSVDEADDLGRQKDVV